MNRETLSDQSGDAGETGDPGEKPGEAGAQKPRVYSEFIETVTLTPEEEQARKRRNLAIALGLVAFIVLIFLVTVVRMTANYNSGA